MSVDTAESILNNKVQFFSFLDLTEVRLGGRL
jgi:hypothetical protein